MRGGRRSLASLGVVFVVLACNGDRRSGAIPATDSQVSDTAAVTSRDTTAAPDTGAGSPERRDSVGPGPEPRPTAAAPKPAAPKPVAPKPVPAPAPAAPAAEPSAPLRDQYHQAPRDTVAPEVYDGWKQFNLNCARCHGEDVLGTTIAPHLLMSARPGGAVGTKEAFVQTVCAGRPEKGMPAWCPLGLEMEKINAIYLYVKGRSAGEIAPGRPARRE